jgi:hypothetical protein
MQNQVFEETTISYSIKQGTCIIHTQEGIWVQ